MVKQAAKLEETLAALNLEEENRQQIRLIFEEAVLNAPSAPAPKVLLNHPKVQKHMHLALHIIAIAADIEFLILANMTLHD